jgi:oligosaccharide repeat unit polymerase
MGLAMISTTLANTTSALSLAVTLGAYGFVSHRERNYLNVLTPSLLVNVPAFYLFQIVYNNLFGVDASAYSYIYVYATLAVESIVFAYVYTRPRTRPIRLPSVYGYSHLEWLALACLGLSCLLFLPLLIEFKEYVFDPRRIYEETRTGFGASYYTSSACAYLAVILILFSRQSNFRKAIAVLFAAIVLSLHGSKGQVLGIILLPLLFLVYVGHIRVKLGRALLVCLGFLVLLIGMFAATVSLGGPMEALEWVSEYSDYMRNAMMVIDSNMPVQYGRLTWESNVISLVPRAVMPDKPKDFGAFYLDEEFYSGSLDEDKGVPAFGIGVQYADFGSLAIVYLGLFAALRGWLTRVWVRRLQHTRHPADFLMLAFLCGISIFTIGTGWLFPETLLVALFLRFASSLGTGRTYREHIRYKPVLSAQGRLLSPGLEGV